jgi:hypothetical protein
MGLAVFAGVAFGVYFVALKLSNPLGLVMPMAIARASSMVLCLVTLGVMRVVGGGPAVEHMSRRRDMGHPVGERWMAGWGWACGVAVLDTGGNLLFMAATQSWGGWMWRRCWLVYIRRERFCWRRGI